MARVRIKAGGLEFVAETLAQAPRTVELFLSLLPYRQQLIHVRWSGEGCWIPLGDKDYGLPWENGTSYPPLGGVLFYPGGFSETEIILAYGPCCFSSKLGQLAGNHFMSIVEGEENLAELGEKCLWQGAQEIVFELDS